MASGPLLPYGETQSFWALSEIVKAQAGILENDGAESARGKLARAVRAAVEEEQRQPWVERHLQPLVGVSEGTATTVDRGQEAFAAWRRFLEGMAERRPLVLVFEDLHWADDGLLDFVDHLSEWVTAVPLLIVASARPELLERRPDWGGGKRNALTVSISSLGEEETAQLLAALLDQALLPVELQSEVLSRSAGNPLYTEEYVRMLQDRGFLERTNGRWQLRIVDRFPLPETVQGMIAARLDALSLPEKEVVQAAAVVGKVFWPSSLGVLLGRENSEFGEALHGLVRKEFVRRDRRSAVADDEQYAFLHVLVRDIAYGQIPRAARAEKHRAAADWIENLAADRTQDRAEMLAHHLFAALELTRKRPVVTRPPCIRASVMRCSPRRSMQRKLYSWSAARNHARKALDLTGGAEPTVRAELALRIAWASFCLGDNNIESAALARESCLAVGDVEAAATAEALRSLMLWYRGQGEEELSAGAAAASLVADRPPSAAKAWVFAVQARRAVVAKHDASGTDLAVQALEMAEEVDRPDLVSHALNTVGLARGYTGDRRALADSRTQRRARA